MGHHTDVFVGIDVARSRNAIATSDYERSGEVRYFGEVDGKHTLRYRGGVGSGGESDLSGLPVPYVDGSLLQGLN